MTDPNSTENKNNKTASKIAWLLLGTLVFGGVAFYLCVITNYENDNPFLNFSPLQILSIILSAFLGSLISFYYHTAQHQRALVFLKAIFVLFSINLIIYGIEGIQKKEIVIRFVRYTGTQAVSYGQLVISLAVLIIGGWVFAPIIIRKIKKRNSKG